MDFIWGTQVKHWQGGCPDTWEKDAIDDSRPRENAQLAWIWRGQPSPTREKETQKPGWVRSCPREYHPRWHTKKHHPHTWPQPQISSQATQHKVKQERGENFPLGFTHHAHSELPSIRREKEIPLTDEEEDKVENLPGTPKSLNSSIRTPGRIALKVPFKFRAKTNVGLPSIKISSMSDTTEGAESMDDLPVVKPTWRSGIQLLCSANKSNHLWDSRSKSLQKVEFRKIGIPYNRPWKWNELAWKTPERTTSRT